MIPIYSPEHVAALKEMREVAIKKLIKKGFDEAHVRRSIAAGDERAVRKMLRSLSRTELRNLFKEDEG